jgi:anti-sigma factor RsiW
MSRHDDIELMQYADGELSEREREAFAKHLETNADARTKLESLEQMHEYIAGTIENNVDSVPDHKFAAMWREVDKAIDEEAPRGIWAKIAAWLDRHRGHVITGVASAGAVATVALVLRSTSDETQAPMPARSIEVLPAAMRTAPVVESLDTPDGTGTVMNFEDEDGHTTVIWVTPADTVEGI